MKPGEKVPLREGGDLESLSRTCGRSSKTGVAPGNGQQAAAEKRRATDGANPEPADGANPEPADGALVRARLTPLLEKFDRMLVAFSGGVDSTYLLAEAVDRLGPDRVQGLIAVSPTLPAHELAEARALAEKIGASLRQTASGELHDPRFVANGPRRCYYCKSALFDLCDAFIAAQPEPDRWAIAYGANRDDLGDHRPGMEAARERGVRAPLLEAGLGKAEIRAASRLLGLPTADKAAFACLSSRFPTSTPITLERLGRVEAAETVLRQAGFRLYRVRFQGATARVEVGSDEVGRFAVADLRRAIIAGVRAAGFDAVEIDPSGYRVGGANAGARDH